LEFWYEGGKVEDSDKSPEYWGGVCKWPGKTPRVSDKRENKTLTKKGGKLCSKRKNVGMPKKHWGKKEKVGTRRGVPLKKKKAYGRGAPKKKVVPNLRPSKQRWDE